MNSTEKKKLCDTPTNTQMCSVYKMIPEDDLFEERFYEALIKSEQRNQRNALFIQFIKN
jgi:hypothetical protein